MEQNNSFRKELINISQMNNINIEMNEEDIEVLHYATRALISKILKENDLQVD